jgi:hypothetical protein
MLALKVKSGEVLEFRFHDAAPGVVEQLTNEIELLLSGD